MLETRLRQDMKESVDKIDEEEESNLFIDPYEGASNVKFLALAAYIFILAGCIILVAFVYYETNGLAGPSRTIFNQMVSWEYRVVSYKVFAQNPTLPTGKLFFFTGRNLLYFGGGNGLIAVVDRPATQSYL